MGDLITPESTAPTLSQSITNNTAAVANKLSTNLNNLIQGNITESMVRINSSLDKNLYDVIRNYPWTLTPMSNASMANRIPAIYLYEYQMTKSMLVRGAQIAATNIVNSANTATAILTNNQNPAYSHYTNNPNSTDAAYDLLFDYSGITNYIYTFPYYNSENINASNQWAASDITQEINQSINEYAPVLGGIGKLANLAVGLMSKSQELRYPNVGFADKPMTWAMSTKRKFTIEFYLYNTLYTLVY